MPLERLKQITLKKFLNEYCLTIVEIIEEKNKTAIPAVICYLLTLENLFLSSG